MFIRAVLLASTLLLAAPPSVLAADVQPVVGLSGQANDEDRVQPYDTLDITVLQLDTLTRQVQVNGVGVLSLPMVGELNVAGQTTRQIAGEITTRLKHDLQDPQVTVTLKEVSQQNASLKDVARRGITVEGSVTQPGIYPLYGPTTLLQGLAMAKGVDQYANEKSVTIFREVDGKSEGAIYNLASIREGKIADPPIYPKDTIVVAGSKVRRFVRDFAPIAPLVYFIPKF